MKKAIIIISIILGLALIGAVMDACDGDKDALESSSVESTTVVPSEEISTEETASSKDDESFEEVSSEQEVSEEPNSSQASSEENAPASSDEKTTIEPSGPSNSDIVYTTETGTKYHSRKSCPGLSRAKAIYESTLGAAKSEGLGACSKCH